MTNLKQGDNVYLHSAGNRLMIGERLGRGGQGTVFGTEMNGRLMAVKWYQPSGNNEIDKTMRANLAELVKRGSPKNPAFVWPIDMVSSRDVAGYGYVMKRVESRFITCFQLIASNDPPDFPTKIQIGLNLVDAFAALHQEGFCYRDISFGNLYTDPATGDMAIIDNDNVGVTGERTLIKGTYGFMAPEVMLERAWPTTESDLYSLAVFLFYLFCHGHPLRGEAVARSEESDHLTEEQVLLRHFAQSPVFVFDPADPSNRPAPTDPVPAWWQVYPAFFRDMFVTSFTTGLHDATLTGRYSEGVWRKALYRLADSIWQCGSCQAALLFDHKEPHKPCWNCRQVPSTPLLLTTPGHAVVLAGGTVLTRRHLLAAGSPDEPIAVVETDARLPGSLLLRNLTNQPWQAQTPGEPDQPVEPGKKLLARPRQIRIAGKLATIVAAGEPGKSGSHD